MTARRLCILAVVIGLSPALAACGRGAEVNDETVVPPAGGATAAQAVRITDVGLGRSIDAQGRIAAGADTDNFARTDTIYVSVNTDGSAAGSRLTARWTFEDGQVVDETSRTLSATGPAITEFHISNPGGFPSGRYAVEILLDGRTVEREEFTIR
jgi:hypothetical protein